MPTPLQGWLSGMTYLKINTIECIDSLNYKGDLIFIPRLALFYKNVNIALIIYWIFENINMNGHAGNKDNYIKKWYYLTSSDLKDKFWWLKKNDIVNYINHLISIDNLIYDPFEDYDIIHNYRTDDHFEGCFAIGKKALWAILSANMTDTAK